MVLRTAVAGYFAAWRLFFTQRSTLATIAFVLLYFNVVLATGPICTTMLAQMGLSSASVSLFHQGAAAFGFAGSMITARLVRKVGLRGAGGVGFAAFGALIFAAGQLYNFRLASLPLVPRDVEGVVSLAGG